MKLTKVLMQKLAIVFLTMSLLGCASVKEPDPSVEEKQSFLIKSVAQQAATGPKNCRLYANGLATRLKHSPYRYDVQPLYYCSFGTLCHVLLKVNTGDAQFVADNGAFIEGHVEPLLEFERRVFKQTAWRQVKITEARLLLMAERYGSDGS